MKLAAILPFIAVLSVSTKGFTQNLTLSAQKASLADVLNQIKKQTGYSFLWEDQIMKHAKPVTVEIKNATISEALDACLKGQGLTYSINQKIIAIKPLPTPVPPGGDLWMDSLHTIHGIVDDEKGLPLAGVFVLVRGTGNGVATDDKGIFTIKAEENAVIDVSLVGYRPWSFKASGGRLVSIVLYPSSFNLEEVVVVGYTQQKKELLTGAISTVNVTQGMTELPVASAADLLAGRVAGVNVGTSTGEPGNQSSASIRTGSSWNSQPVLYVIDGMIRDAGTFQNLAPNEIESITVLKDAASAAIYGVRSDGGVIVVTTKRGKYGSPSINYTASYSSDFPTQQVPLTNLYQAGVLINQMYANANSIDPQVNATPPQGTAWSQQELNWADSLPGHGYNSLKEVWNTPFIMNHGLSVSGGGDRVRYFASANYYDQGGFLKSTDYQKWNIRLNVTADITSNLQLYTGVAMSDTYTAQAPGEGTDATYEKLRASFNDIPVYSTQGDRYLTTGWAYGNPAAEANGLIGYEHTWYINPQANIGLTYQIPVIKGLCVKASYMGDWANSHYKEYDAHATFWYPIFSGPNNHIVHANDADLTTNITNNNFWGLYSTANWKTDYQLDFQISYSRNCGKHHIDAAGVFEKAQSSYSSMWNQNQGFPVYQIDQYWAANSDHNDMWSGGGPDYITGRASNVGQINYTYAEKYLLNLSVREDGSMYFAPNRRWGVFPAGSAGWILTKESFLRDNKIITHLKLRGSVGLTGNDAVVSGWQWQQSYQSGSTYYFGNTPSANVGIQYGSIVNPNLTWEKSLSYNAGVDFEVIKHLAGSVDYWFKHTYDILGNRQNTLPTTFSLTLPQENYGVVNAQGQDLTIAWHDRTRAVDWHIVLNASYGWNKVITEDYPVSDLPWQVPAGKSTNYVAGYTSYVIKTAGQLAVWKNANPNYVNPGQGNTAVGLGSMVYMDRSGSQGRPDGVINNYDQTVLYANTNHVVYGIVLGAGWKGFTIEAVFNGLLHNPENFSELADYYEVQMFNTRWMDQSWTPSNPKAPLPMVVPREYRSYSVGNSSFWYKDASFIRLKNLNMNYTFHFKGELGNEIKSLRVFTSATNLFYISKFKYWDPELSPGWSGIGYPIMRTFSGGVNVDF